LVLLTPHRAVELTLLTFAKFREIKVVTENNESITESDKWGDKFKGGVVENAIGINPALDQTLFCIYMYILFVTICK
jgi:hypothetical protein